MSPSDTLRAQAAAWNAGDLEAFLSMYADDAVFVGASGVVEGRDAVAARYAAAYPDRSAMGTLTFDVRSEDVRGERAVVVLAWSLGDGRGGHALVVLDHDGAGWVVRHDATVALS